MLWQPMGLAGKYLLYNFLKKGKAWGKAGEFLEQHLKIATQNFLELERLVRKTGIF